MYVFRGVRFPILDFFFRSLSLFLSRWMEPFLNIRRGAVVRNYGGRQMEIC